MSSYRTPKSNTSDPPNASPDKGSGDRERSFLRRTLNGLGPAIATYFLKQWLVAWLEDYALLATLPQALMTEFERLGETVAKAIESWIE